MIFEAVQYLDSDFPNEILFGILDTDTNELYPMTSAQSAIECAREMNNGRLFSFGAFPSFLMLTISEIKTL